MAKGDNRSEKYITIPFSHSRLAKRNRQLAALMEMSAWLVKTEDVCELMEGCLDIVMSRFGMDTGRLYAVSDDRTCLELKAHRGMDVAGLEQIRFGEGFTGRAALTKSFLAQRVEDLGDSERARILRSRGIRIVICVPLLVAGRLEGVMNLGARRSIRLNQNRVDLLMAMGQQIAVALSHCRLMGHLSRKVEELHQRKEVIKFFASSISHDLKGPIIAAYGFARRLLARCQDSFDDKTRFYCSQIMKSCQAAMELLEQINSLVHTREMPMRLEEVALEAVVQEVCEELSEICEKLGVSVKIACRLPVIVADRIMITRVLRNLIHNAIKHGGADLIEVGCDETPTHYVLWVKDNGQGIPEEAHKDLFKPFHAIYSPGSNRTPSGSGLGLSIVREVAERHRGSVWVHSKPGAGSVFHVSIAKQGHLSCCVG
ncbi:GAF domain-containing sensor histidine kinase [Thermodesulforhabdus norvegica]|uniref:histidine kinase n=1 Tax=Thermodesulforhabdus norvegica TaxID=39841 RepID=A0A1I4SI99_9BACT|nr:HAMP domain-containing sensor histidine kinase [Thermodesulforhabdus norvegica]SFM64134.1 Signal transduction histidine kinase [Thermodesulforhabdus norvegica]